MLETRSRAASLRGLWRRSVGSARLAVLSQFEYRFNLIADTVIQPVLTAVVEVALWWALFWSIGTAAGLAAGEATLGGFGRDYYLSYALWAAFFSRIYASWMYEFRMTEEIDTGAVNSILVRPLGFYEYYLAQFMAYKVMTAAITLSVWLVFTQFFDSQTIFSRLPLALALAFFHLFLVHTISFCIASCAFFYNRVHSFTVAKNISLWMLSGELFPLDLMPEPLRSILINLPFACGVYVPVGYVTGRFGAERVWSGFLSIAIGLVVFGLLASVLWNAGRRRYTGQGA